MSERLSGSSEPCFLSHRRELAGRVRPPSLYIALTCMPTQRASLFVVFLLKLCITLTVGLLRCRTLSRTNIRIMIE